MVLPSVCSLHHDYVDILLLIFIHNIYILVFGGVSKMRLFSIVPPHHKLLLLFYCFPYVKSTVFCPVVCVLLVPLQNGAIFSWVLIGLGYNIKK